MGTNTIATSSDGITWTGLGTSTFSGSGIGIAWNAGLGSVSIQNNSLSLNEYGPGLSSKLDIVAPPYYNT